jgi:hypothetical protein
VERAGADRLTAWHNQANYGAPIQLRFPKSFPGLEEVQTRFTRTFSDKSPTLELGWTAPTIKTAAMASEYPPLPDIKDDSVSQLSQPALPPISPRPPQYDSTTASLIPPATIAAAHHGLQALQAATASASASGPGLSPPVSHYPPPLSPADGSQQQYAIREKSSPASNRQSRLRRACDMCSARKVRVR